MPRIDQRLLWTALLATGSIFASSWPVSAGICEYCQEEKRPQYIPVCEPSYGFHRTGWRAWDPRNLHWHPQEHPSGVLESPSTTVPMPHLPPAPVPGLPNWTVPAPSFPVLPQQVPPLPTAPPEFAPTPSPISTSKTEHEPRPVFNGIPVRFVGHSTLKPPQPTPITAPANPYGDYRKTQPPR